MKKFLGIGFGSGRWGDQIGQYVGVSALQSSAKLDNYYPLSVQAHPGRELSLRVEFDTDVFDVASVETLMGRLRRVLVAMTADSGRES